MSLDSTKLNSFSETLRDSEIRLDKLLDALSDGIYDYNMLTKETVVTENFYRILGYEPNEFKVTEEKWDSLVHPDDIDQANQLFDDHINNVTSRYAAEYRMLCKDGHYEWVNCTGKIIEYKNDEPFRVIGSIASIQSRKKLEEAMQIVIEGTNTLRGLDFFQFMVKRIAQLLSVNYAVITSRISPSSKELEAIAMWEVDNLKDSFKYNIQGTPCELIYTDKTISFHDDHLFKLFPKDTYLKKRGIVSYYGIPFCDPSNLLLGHLYIMSEKPIELLSWKVSAMKIFSQSLGSEIERLSNEEQLTALNKTLDKKVKKRTKQLSRAMKDLDDFFYKSSHDLRAPITTLEGISLLLKEEENTEKVFDILHLLETQIGKIKSLNDSIIEVGTLRNCRVNRKQLILHNIVIKAIRKLAIPQKTCFDVNLDKDLKVESDSYLMGLIICNILQNAIDFSDSEKGNCEIQVSFIENATKIILSIRDNGMGISQRLQSEIFQMFFRGSNSSSGFGLGLYKAKIAADRLGINLELEGKELIGTTVKIIIPK
ncbi:MAG: PAS domain-containing protein [Ekhidna sp.]